MIVIKEYVPVSRRIAPKNANMPKRQFSSHMKKIRKWRKEMTISNIKETRESISNDKNLKEIFKF